MSPKDDIREVNAAAVALGMTGDERNAFGRFLEAEKAATGGGTKNARGDYTYLELLELGRLFLDEFRAH